MWFLMGSTWSLPPSLVQLTSGLQRCDWPINDGRRLMEVPAQTDLRPQLPLGGWCFLHQQAEKRGRLVWFPV